ncbi:hypothetical protein JCM31826_01780 [Thermaurantimonas aggregans]|uniref:Uncharacterized protein n=1 Tax=Thermaurantimonas aggregans TaxID=2173829 RepID=A0A401XI51_9FLAO|nr:hypothetical protein [Thermaurantimonas aggregans]MCX8149299.1 hypothetical protein [Thermaurantimonas aggregans]GCD76696.1 hypothetical protein JCM31826_01780 [Thermaurantimonas aggregans]
MKKLVILIAVLALIGLSAGLYLYFKPVKNLTEAKADYTLVTSAEADEIAQALLQNQAFYYGKIFEWTGRILEIALDEKGGGYLLLEIPDTKLLINAQLDFRVRNVNIQSGEVCTIRGEFTGLEEDLIDPDALIIYFKQSVVIQPTL